MISRLTAAVPVFLASVATLWGARPSQAQSYLGVDLTPAGAPGVRNFALSIFDGQVGGSLGFVDPHLSSNATHAVVWTGASRYSDLTPFTDVDAFVGGLAAGQQVGQQSIAATSFYPHAYLWTGSAASGVDLNPAGFFTSRALATDGMHQVGDGNIGTSPETQWSHALLWSGSAASYVDLNPANYQSSTATALSGNHQVGSGEQVVIGGVNHALLWSGTAASATDLNPSGFSWSEADGIRGTQIVGWGTPDNAAFAAALLWNGSADSYVNLSPAGFTRAYARGTNGHQQVGEVGNDPIAKSGWHAALWTGTAASYVDLNRFLPPGFVSAYALAIDDAGNVAGYGFDSAGLEHALEWLAPIPGDINGDRRVDFTDLLTLAQHYAMTPATWADGDFNGDGTVNFDDLLLLAQHYGQAPSPAQLGRFSPSTGAEVEQAFAQVPEPATLLPLAIAAALRIRLRRR